MHFAEIRQRGEGFGQTSGLQIRIAQVVGDIIAEISGMNLGMIQRIDGFGEVAIQHVRVSNHQPSQRSGIIFRMSAGKSFDTCVSAGIAILQKLLRHGSQAGRGDKSLPHPAYARRDYTFLRSDRVTLAGSCSWLLRRGSLAGGFAGSFFATAGRSLLSGALRGRRSSGIGRGLRTSICCR